MIAWRPALFFSQDPVHKWAGLQRALLTEGQSVWCCKGCIGIIKENKDKTYEEIRVKVEAKAAPLPEVSYEPADPLQKAEAAVKAAEAVEKAAVTSAEAAEEAAMAAKPTAAGMAGVEIREKVEQVATAPLPDTSATLPAPPGPAPAAPAAPAAPPVVNVTICHCGIL